MNKFIIFGQERSGTTSLISALNKNDNVVHEPLSSLSGDIRDNVKLNNIITKLGMEPSNLPKSKHIPYFNKFNDLTVSYDNIKCYFDEIFSTFDGVKHIWCTVAEKGNENLIKYCIDNKIKILFQYRLSLFDAAISWQLGNQTQVWQLGEKLENKKKIDNFNFKPLQEDQIKRRISWYQNMIPSYKLLADHGDCMKVIYESVFSKLSTFREEYFYRICEFLGVKYFDENNFENFIMKKRKVYTEDHYSGIPNYKEMQKKYGSEMLYL